jgi:hypothetical protein
MKKIYLLLISIFCYVTGTFSQVTISGSTGANGTYTTLTNAGGAFAAINSAGSQAGNTIIITITADIAGETGTNGLSYLNWSRLIINPSGNRTVSGSVATSLITFFSSQKILIDGLNSGGNSLTISNTNTGISASTIIFSTGTIDCRITNCTILGSSTGTAGNNSPGSGTIFFYSASGGGCDRDTIDNNNIGDAASGAPSMAIAAIGFPGDINDDCVIRSNNIYNWYANTSASGINIGQYSSGWTIDNNRMYKTGFQTGMTAAFWFRFIYINTTGTGFTISNNIMGYAASAGTGMLILQGAKFAAMDITVGTGASSSVQGNTVNNIKWTSDAAAAGFGTNNSISFLQFSGLGNIGTVTGNTFGETGTTASTTNGIYLTSNYNVSGPAVGINPIYVSGAACTVQNNDIGSITLLGQANTSMQFYGIVTDGNFSHTVTNNRVGGSVPNSISLGNAGTTNITEMRAIYNNSGGSSSTVNIGAVGAGNTIQNISANGISAYSYLCIFNSGSPGTLNINYNSFTNNSMAGTGNYYCVFSQGTPTTALNINNNTVNSGTISTTAYTSAAGFLLNAGGGSVTTDVSISNNTLSGMSFTGTTSTNTFYCIFNQLTWKTVTIDNNNFNNLSLKTNGTVYLCNNSSATPTISFSNNFITTGFSKTSGSNNLFCYNNQANPSGGTSTINNNNFSNVTLTGTTGFYGINQAGGTSHVPTITNNIFNNIANPNGVVSVIVIDKGTDVNCSSNTITNISGSSNPLTGILWSSNNGSGTHTCSSNIISNFTGTGNIYGIFHNCNTGGGTFNYSSNTISSLVSSGTGGDVDGIYCDAAVPLPVVNIFNNTITGLSSTRSNGEVNGIDLLNGAATTNMYNNTINNLGVSGAGSPVVNGIFLLNGTVINIYGNKINTLQATGAISATSGAVNGLLFSNGVNVTAHNNFIADLKAPNANLADAVRGISVTSITPSSNYNLYYNSIYLDAGSTGINFGTSGIYHASSATATTAALSMIDNIIVNTSTPNGTGVTAAYRRSNATLTNFVNSSDHNLFYAGTPSAGRLIFYDGTNSDQTLAAYQTRVSTRDANSISLMPIFTSATDLHLTTANCGIDGRGTPIVITTDIDNSGRDVTTPDIGADEFTASYGPALAGVAATAVCDNKTVSPGGTNYGTSLCELIASVVPSGADPVAGKINVCVTLDASQLYFNGEPYVQRHFDLEPATSNQTTTSATVHMYFTDAEFALYNANNPVWPKLPTIAGGGNGDPNIANVKVTQFHGTPTGGLPTSTPGNYTGSRVLLTPINVGLNGSTWFVVVNVAGFSGFYVHTNSFNTPLPVSINYFTGVKQGSNHLLNWKVTCNTTPRLTMILERSADSRNFTVINTVVADALRCNQPFDHTDTDPLQGMNYYRLKMIDADGKISYSAIVALLNASKGFDIISIAPNPVTQGNFKLNIASAQDSKMELVILDMQGRLVNSQIIAVIAGSNNIRVQVENLSAGTYTMYGRIGEDRSRMIRFVKQ